MVLGQSGAEHQVSTRDIDLRVAQANHHISPRSSPELRGVSTGSEAVDLKRRHRHSAWRWQAPVSQLHT